MSTNKKKILNESSQIPEISPIAPDIWHDPRSIHRMRYELSNGFRALAEIDSCVAFFGSARTFENNPDYKLASAVAEKLGKQGFAIMTGGGPGVMEAANRGAQKAGAVSIGCHIDLPFEEHTNNFIDIELHFNYLFTRKVMFVRHATTFIVFPGGFGTLDEFFEVLMLMQTGKVHSRPVILVRKDWWEGIVAWMDEKLVNENKVAPGDLNLFTVEEDVDEIVNAVVKTTQTKLPQNK